MLNSDFSKSARVSGMYFNGFSHFIAGSASRHANMKLPNRFWPSPSTFMNGITYINRLAICIDKPNKPYFKCIWIICYQIYFSPISTRVWLPSRFHLAMQGAEGKMIGLRKSRKKCKHIIHVIQKLRKAVVSIVNQIDSWFWPGV